MNWMYLAGLFDGEGAICLSIRRLKRSRIGYTFVPYLSIAQSNLELLRSIRAFIGSGSIIHEQGSKRRTHVLIISGSRSCLKIAQELLPRLILKHKRMELFIEALRIIGSYQDLLKQKARFGPMERPLKQTYRLLEIVDGIRKLNDKHPPTATPTTAVRDAILSL